MTKNEDLKSLLPCPFCPTGRIVKSSHFYVHLNRLERCPLNGISWNEDSENFKAWNVRVTDTAMEDASTRENEGCAVGASCPTSSTTDGDAEVDQAVKRIDTAYQSGDAEELQNRMAHLFSWDLVKKAALQSTRKPPVCETCAGTGRFGKNGDDFICRKCAPVDTITVPREVLQGVRESMAWAIGQIDNEDAYSHHTLTKALASLDAVLAEGE